MARILIVEDEFPIALELNELLTASGYEVAGMASDANEAVAMAMNGRPDLVLMDIRLPGKMDGIDAAVRIGRELHIPSVFLTGLDKVEFVERAKAADPLGYILKPLNENQILATLKIAVHKMEKEKAVRTIMDRTEKTLNEKSA